MDNYNKLTLLQLKILKSKEKDNIKKENIINAINKIVKTSQVKWSPNSLLINNTLLTEINENNTNSKKLDSDTSDITVSTLSSYSSEDNNKNKQLNNFTNYDITKYYNKVSNKKDDNDKLFTRMMNFADCLETKKPKDINHINKPYKENIKNTNKTLGKRKYIN